MRVKAILVLIMCLIFFSNSESQAISKTEKKAIIGKVWGLIKYHHPNIQDGRIDLDADLIKMLELVDDDNDENDILTQWLQTIKPLGKEKSISEISKGFNKNYDFEWLENSNILNRDLVEQLIEIKNFNRNKSHYVQVNGKIGNIEIVNEKKYNINDMLDKNTRLVILIKYWNIIEYFFPYKYMIDRDWNEVLKEYIEIFSQADSKLKFQLAFLSLTVELDDSHANFFTADIIHFFGSKYIPSYFKVINNQVILTGHYDKQIASQNGLKVGDIILKADGITVNELMNKMNRYVSGSNKERKKYNYRYSLLNGSSDSVNLTILRGTDSIQLQVKRYEFGEFNLESVDPSKWKKLDNDILYLKAWLINGKDIKDIIKLLKGSKGMIVDLRSYPNFNIHDRIVEIIKSKNSEYYQKIVPDIKNPSHFIYKESNPSGSKGSYKYNSPIVVLVDSRTMSYAEFIVMDLQSCENVKVIGSKSAGAVGFMSTFNVFDDALTSFTGTGIFYPDYSEVQGNGVRLDKEIDFTLADVISESDKLLDEGILLLNTKFKNSK